MEAAGFTENLDNHYRNTSAQRMRVVIYCETMVTTYEPLLACGWKKRFSA
jgi:hypothetical protein